MTNLGIQLYAAYTLHDRAGTLASLLYKAEKPSVCLSVCPSTNFVTEVTRLFQHGTTWDLASGIAVVSDMRIRVIVSWSDLFAGHDSAIKTLLCLHYA